MYDDLAIEHHCVRCHLGTVPGACGVSRTPHGPALMFDAPARMLRVTVVNWPSPDQPDEEVCGTEALRQGYKVLRTGTVWNSEWTLQHIGRIKGSTLVAKSPGCTPSSRGL